MEELIEQFIDTREEYKTEMQSIISGINPKNQKQIDINKLIQEFKDASKLSTKNMGALSERHFEQDLLRYGFEGFIRKIINEDSILSDQDMLDNISEENRENIVNFLAQEEYRGITLSQIATLIRYQLVKRLNDKIASTARRQANISGEDRRRFHGSSSISKDKIAEDYKRKMGYINTKNNNRFLQIVIELENKIMINRIKEETTNKGKSL